MSKRPSTKTMELPLALPDASWRASFRRRLRSWYARSARDLPWRRSADPYAVWVSEIMLQQTQVATVMPYFERFTQRFPTVTELANADEQEVLLYWEGLGYYRRARQLHLAARAIVQQHQGVFPREPGAVRDLPGIGRYTAGAILSIAFDAREPILEANTIRLFSRLLAYGEDPTRAVGNRLLWAMAEAVLPRKQIGAFNQALMELGSQVCQPRNPACDTCPVASLCQARLEGVIDRIPLEKAKMKFEDRHEVAVIVRHEGAVLLVRYPEGGRWAGLWDFPRFAPHAEQPAAMKREVAQAVRQHTGVEVRLGKHLKRLKHGVTRFRIQLDCYQGEYLSNSQPTNNAWEVRWVSPNELADYPLNSTGRQLAELV